MAVVIYRAKARRDLGRIYMYGVKEFGIRTAEKMMHQIDYCVLLLSLNPKLGKVEPILVGHRYEYRSLVVHPHFKLIYYINKDKDRIVITNLWDTRQEPQALKEETKQ